MPVGIQGVMSWQSWRTEVTADDTVLNTTFEPGDLVLAEAAGQVISVDTFTAIMIFPLAIGDDGDDAVLKIIGYMASHTPGGGGPGMVLWTGTIAVGAVVMSAATPHVDGKWSSGNWGFIKTIVQTADATSAVELASPTTTPTQMCLLFPTVGFTRLVMEVTDIGAATELHRFGCLWRGVSKEGAI